MSADVVDVRAPPRPVRPAGRRHGWIVATAIVVVPALAALLMVIGLAVFHAGDGRPGIQAALRNALDTGTVTNMQAAFAPKVEYAIAASGSFGTTSPAGAAQLISSYLKDAAGPWDFTIPPATLTAYQHGPYQRYLADDTYFAASPGRFFIAVRVNAGGRIDQVFLAASTDLLR